MTDDTNSSPHWPGRDVIGAGQGMIMERFNVDAFRAFDMLRRISQDSNTPVKDIARRLTGAELAGPGGK